MKESTVLSILAAIGLLAPGCKETSQNSTSSQSVKTEQVSSPTLHKGRKLVARYYGEANADKIIAELQSISSPDLTIRQLVEKATVVLKRWESSATPELQNDLKASTRKDDVFSFAAAVLASSVAQAQSAGGGGIAGTAVRHIENLDRVVAALQGTTTELERLSPEERAFVTFLRDRSAERIFSPLRDAYAKYVAGSMSKAEFTALATAATDELRNAHPEVWKYLLQLGEKARDLNVSTLAGRPSGFSLAESDAPESVYEVNVVVNYNYGVAVNAVVAATVGVVVVVVSQVDITP